jgi:hypothetical protein
VDQWPVLRGPHERGATFDGARNAPCVRDSGEVMRYDRVLLLKPSPPGPLLAIARAVGQAFHAADADADKDAATNLGKNLAAAADAEVRQWRGQRIEMLGTEPINEAGVRPSDHFGLEFDCILTHASE